MTDQPTSTSTESTVCRAPRGTELTCANWQIEAVYRMVQNNLDPEVAEDPENLIVYGGLGKAARNAEALHKILATLRRLQPDETMLVQSGKCVGVFKSHVDAPRVLIANSNLVGDWANWDEFRRLDKLGLIMYGQMTAGSWIYIGSQGIVQGTYETFVAAAKKHYDSNLKGRLVVTAGLGGMGGAQPLAITMAGGVCLAADVEGWRIDKRLETKYLDERIDDPKQALAAAQAKAAAGVPWSIGVCCNATELLETIRDQGVVPDMLTDQTSAHDMLVGYIPDGMSVEQANVMRDQDPQRYLEESGRTCARHVALMLELQEKGAITFDYGNNVRTEARDHGVAEAFRIPGFIPEYIRPLFCHGRGPFRWVALSGDPKDIQRTDELALEMFADNESLCTWIKKAQEKIAWQGLPSRILWLGYGERAKFGLAVNELIRTGEISAPIVFGRDHLDCGSVASPYRETEAMKDGSDMIADWPLLNGMLAVASGATWVSLHHGGGVGMGKSIHAGQVTVADGTEEAAARIQRVFTCDPGMGIVRHADAGYEDAQQFAADHDVDLGG
ncbi:MAG: urocanate hydratase [Planctomycetota bacterium]|nr:urocanate hydratase [Planctomycetota bacterium]MEC8652446.1 urocanate hydratase [Planctomycetota bacterium]MEC9049062.1 urocanate hydratase [Planctomycetota bacterium]